jgi:hypothetical protein
MWTQDMIDSARRKVAEWQGGNVRLWHYTASHSELHLQVTMPGRGGMLHLVCEGCSHIMTPTGWGNMNLEVIPVQDADRQIVVSDAVAGFRVVCAIVSERYNSE